jgi:hypothetical protein
MTEKTPAIHLHNKISKRDSTEMSLESERSIIKQLTRRMF